jgi:hypothetical protein
MKFPQILLTTLCAIFVSPFKTVSACSVCFGDPGSPLVQSISLGIWVMLGIVMAVLALFALLFWNIRGRMRKFEPAHS